MTTISKQALSGSTDGLGIKVAATASTGTTIHTAPSGTSSWDEVWIYAVNTSSTAVKLTIQYGGTTSPDNDIEVTIAGESGEYLVIPGHVLRNSKVIYAFAATANVIVLYGHVNRIT